ncbi:MAG: hypothetical protein FWD94_03570 [Treponema sp.]|nr:hypothetical protein [Treponema sp.]
MPSVKFALLPAIVAGILSLLLSLVFGHTHFLVALIRSGIFLAVFFALSFLVHTLLVSYFPGLLPGAPVPEAESPNSGGRLNITLGDDDDVFASGLGEDAPAGLSNASGLSDGGLDGGDLPEAGAPASPEDTAASKQPDESGSGSDLDLSGENGYTPGLTGLDFADGTENEGLSSGADFGGLGDFGSFLDGLSSKRGMMDSDDSLSDIFQSFGPSSVAAPKEEAKTESGPVSARNQSAQQTAAATAATENFSPKEIAMGIQTVLAKERKG